MGPHYLGAFTIGDQLLVGRGRAAAPHAAHPAAGLMTVDPGRPLWPAAPATTAQGTGNSGISAQSSGFA
jgi:hypothetical protein